MLILRLYQCVIKSRIVLAVVVRTVIVLWLLPISVIGVAWSWPLRMHIWLLIGHAHVRVLRLILTNQWLKLLVPLLLADLSCYTAKI